MEANADFPGLLGSAQVGDEWAVAALFRRFHPSLLRYLRAREPRVADDLEGEVWLAIAERLPAFRGGEPEFRAWVFSIARRRLADPEMVVVEGLAAAEAAAFVVRTLAPDQAEVVLLGSLRVSMSPKSPNSSERNRAPSACCNIVRWAASNSAYPGNGCPENL